LYTQKVVMSIKINKNYELPPVFSGIFYCAIIYFISSQPFLELVHAKQLFMEIFIFFYLIVKMYHCLK
jgi:hypothetical protein